MKVTQLTYNGISLINAPRIHTDLLWDLSILFAGLGLLYFVFIFFFRNRISSKSAMVAQRKRELAPMISNFLFFGEDASKEEKNDYVNLKIEIRELLKEKFNRKILTEILLDLQKDVSGDARTRLFRLYTDLGLHLDAFGKLKSMRWEVISQGILELTQMQVGEAYGFIKKFINHRRGVIRQQAQIATVTLKNEGINYFLDTNKYSISEWQQLKLLDVIRNLENFDPPRFNAWLTSKNKDVVLFSLRLIKYYNQSDASASIIQLVKHRNNQIRTEAIHCIKEFCFFDALETLKNVFWKSNIDIKILILDTIAALGKEEEIAFLKSIGSRESNFNVKSKALSAINVISPESVMPKEGIDESLTEAKWEDMEPIISAEDTPNETEHTKKVNIELAEESTDNPKEWANVLDPKTEDEAIFELCMMEELKDILYESAGPEDSLLGQVEFLPLDFLPIVAEDETILEEGTPNKLTEDILLMDVDADEVFDESFKQELSAILEKLNDSVEDAVENDMEPVWDFLPIVIALEEEEETVPDTDNRTQLPDRDINAIDVVFEEVIHRDLPETLKELQIDSREEQILEPDLFVPIDWTNKEERPKENNTISEEHNENSNPKPIIMEQEVLKGFCIFEELFRTCDAESKLILMDEILAVGDEKEVLFLDTLLHDPDKRIRTKAVAIKEQLLAKIEQNRDKTVALEEILSAEKEDSTEIGTGNNAVSQDSSQTSASEDEIEPETPEENHENGLRPLDHCFLMEELEIDPPKPLSVFDVNFELGDPLDIDGVALTEKNTEEEKSQNQGEEQYSLLDSLLSIPVKFIEKFNG